MLGDTLIAYGINWKPSLMLIHLRNNLPTSAHQALGFGLIMQNETSFVKPVVLENQ